MVSEHVPRRCRQSSLNPPVHTSQHTAKSVKAAKASDTPRDASFVVGSLISCGLPSLGSRGVRPSSSMVSMHADCFGRRVTVLPGNQTTTRNHARGPIQVSNNVDPRHVSHVRPPTKLSASPQAGLLFSLSDAFSLCPPPPSPLPPPPTKKVSSKIISASNAQRP